MAICGTILRSGDIAAASDSCATQPSHGGHDGAPLAVAFGSSRWPSAKTGSHREHFTLRDVRMLAVAALQQS